MEGMERMVGMRVAVTGAAGLVGRKTVEVLKRAGWEVLPLSRAVRPGYLTTDYTVNSLAAIFADADAVVHLAAERGGEGCLHQNQQLTENVLLAMKQSKRCRRIVYLSSISVYSGEETLPWSEQTLPRPEGEYGLSKLAGEHLCAIYQKAGIRYTVLRCAHILGIEDRGYMLSRFFDGAFRRQAICVTGKSVARREFIYVKDAAGGILWALGSEESVGQTFNLGYGKGYTNLQIAGMVNRAFGNEGNLRYIADQEEGIRSSYTDVRKITKAGFRPAFTIETAMQDLFREYCRLKRES